jgi:hypothetical protein
LQRNIFRYVRCFLLLIFLSWSTMLRQHALSNLSHKASQALSPAYALNRAHMRDIFLLCVNVSKFESFLWCANYVCEPIDASLHNCLIPTDIQIKHIKL